MIKLVLLPGMDGTGRFFEPFAKAIAPECAVQVVRYPADPRLGYAELEAMAAAELPREGPFVVLGESFSGPIAISLAAARPKGLVGLVLCATFASNPRRSIAFLDPLIRLIPWPRLPAGLVARLLLGQFATPELRRLLAETLSPLPSALFRARLRAVSGVDVSNRLPEIDVPILYLRASRDRLVRRGASERILRHAPHAKVVDFHGPHLLLEALPIETARAVGSFLRELPDRA